MKKYFLSILALALGLGMAQAGPVSVSQAKYVGQQFVQANFEETRQSAELTLVYTGTSTRGDVGYYVFNVGSDGFVIVSGDDNFRPLIAYSEEGNYDLNNPTSAYYLNAIAEYRSGINNVVDPLVPVEWESVRNTGRLISRNGGRSVPFLVQTKWDQSPAPYNSMCPADSQSPNAGYHAYTGCVATAMSQIMKYWNYPAQGQGSNSYIHPKYGMITANFGNTTYDWDNMLNSYSSGGYTTEQGNAVATICFHCGVAVNMDYGGDVEEGSGANTANVPSAISNYFRYSSTAYVVNKPSANSAWENLLKEQLDLGWPVLYSGTEANAPYGHAFICDGYNDDNMFHINWGWGGSNNNYFLIEDIEYSTNVRGVLNFVPSDVYDNTAQAPINFTVTPNPDNALSATLSWRNPSKNLSNANLTSIDRIIVTRNGEVVYTADNVTPGADMTAVDNSVPRYDAFNYCVYAVVNGAHGKIAYKNRVCFGPTCNWTLNITQATSMSGFNGGAIHIFNSCGTEFSSVTTTTSGVQSIPIDMPLGNITLSWTAPTSGSAFNMGFTLKDSENQVIYSYSGSSNDMPVGVFHQGNNSCGGEAPEGVATNCVALVDEENPNTIHVSWDPIESVSGYGYAVYRDGMMHRLVPEGTSFVDENVPLGGHCYYVGYLGEGGENGLYSNESCATAGTDCLAATNMDYEYTGSAYKIKVKWEKPVPATGLSGYYLYRRVGEEGEYTRIKVLGANATNYTDNSANQDGVYYYYKLYTIYTSIDCTSAPANWIGDPNQFYLRVLYSTDGVDEMEANDVALFPNPTTDRFTVEAEGLSHVTVFNALGQKVYDIECHSESVDINLNNVETGVYMVRIATAKGLATKRVTIIK